MIGWYVYLLQCADNTLYCGSTTMLYNRIKLHNAGKGARYTKSRLPVTLKAWIGPLPDRSTAQRFEAKVKRLPRDEKLRAFVKEVAPWILDKNSPSIAPTAEAPFKDQTHSAQRAGRSTKRGSRRGSTPSS